MSELELKVSQLLAAEVPDPEGRFSGMPICVNYVNGIEWELRRAISYTTLAREVSTVKKGFVFDFASVPRFFYWLYPPAGDGSNLYGIAATWHDWLYAHRKIGNRPIERYEADELFLEIMRYVGVRWTMARLMYYAVRSPAGWWIWHRRKESEIIP